MLRRVFSVISAASPSCELIEAKANVGRHFLSVFNLLFEIIILVQSSDLHIELSNDLILCTVHYNREGAIQSD